LEEKVHRILSLSAVIFRVVGHIYCHTIARFLEKCERSATSRYTAYIPTWLHD